MTLEQPTILKDMAKEKKYGRGPNHAIQVRRLGLKIYDGLVRLGIFDGADQDRKILEAAALLHDIGLPKKPHN